MPSHQSAVSTLIREVLADPDLAHDDVFRRLLQAGLQDLVDAEAAAVIGAQRYERTPERTNRRNGKRLKTVATTAGEVELAIPELRTGSFFPSLLHPRRRVDKAQMRRDLLRPESRGSPPARPGDLVRALGNESGISRSTVSRIRDGHRRGGRRLPEPHPGSHLVPLRLRRRHLPGRESGPEGGLPGAGGGHRRVGPGPPGDPGTWPWGTPRPPISGRPCPAVPARARAQGPLPHDPEGVVLVTSDAHAGIRAAVRAILPGAAWQRCRAPLRPHHHHPGSVRPAPEPAGALVSMIFAPTSQEAVAAQYKHVIDALKDAFPEIAQMLIDAEPDPTAFAAFPREHWTKIRPQQPHRAPWAARSSAEQTSPRVFPDSDSARPLTGSVLPEQRGVAVRRTPPPLPDLPATPDRHAPGRQQHRRHRQSRRPARHHHLTGRTPHQET